MRPCSATSVPLLALFAALACGVDDPGADQSPPPGAGDTAAARSVAGDPDRAPGSFGLPGPDPERLCAGIRNSLECARAVESDRLPRTQRAARRGDTLLLALHTGDTTRLVDRRGDPADVAVFSFQDYWADPGLFVIHQQYYEGSEHLLIQDSTGDRTAIPDRPLPAPGGSRFAVLALDLVAGYGPNTLQIWHLTADQPRKEHELEPDRWGPRDGEWSDSLTLHFTRRGYCEALGPGATERAGMCEAPAVLRREGGSWILETEPADRDA